MKLKYPEQGEGIEPTPSYLPPDPEPGEGKKPRKKGKMMAWYQASRPPFYIATMVPLTLGFVLAARDMGQWPIGRFLLVNLAAFMVHLATNLADDLFDHLHGADAGESIGGSRVIQEGSITIGALTRALVVLYLAAGVVAIVLIRWSGQPWIWSFALFAWFSSFFYVAPPIKYGYLGLGELSAFLNMGLIMTGGTYWVLTGGWRWDLVAYSIPVGLMVANILYFQSLPDIETDRQVGKFTLAVRLGRKRAGRIFRIWWPLTYISLVSLYLLGLCSWVIWLSLATVPLYVKADRLIHTTQNWVELDGHGHLVRKLYLINGIVLIAAVVTL